MIIERILELLTGKEGAEALVKKLIAASEDFAEGHQQFEAAIDYMRSTLSKDASTSVNDLIDAIDRQITSQIIFSGHLGFQANVDHFINPVARTFTDVDSEVYLRERVAKAMPVYADAQAVIGKFYAQLSLEQKERYECVRAYIAHLDTVVPKLAHYKGFLLGNELLRYVIPYFQPDLRLTLRYLWMLREYLQCQV